MDYLKNEIKVYKPLIEQFSKDTKSLYDTIWLEKIDFDFSGIFIPHVLKNYHTAEKKIFYVGRDTLDWINLKNVYTSYRRKKLDEYIKENNDWPLDFEKMLKYIQSTKTNVDFWTSICRIQLAIHGLDYNIDINENLPAKIKKLVTSIGWGNVYALEKLETVNKYTVKVDANSKPVSVSEFYDHKKYKKILEYARPISKIKNIIDVYNPDIIIILSWENGIEEWLFEGLDYTWNENDFIDSRISTYTINESGKKIIWCNHPNRLKYFSLDLESGLINPILNVL